MKNQALFSSKGKSKKLKCRLLQLLFSTLRIKSLLDVLYCRVTEPSGDSLYKMGKSAQAQL